MYLGSTRIFCPYSEDEMTNERIVTIYLKVSLSFPLTPHASLSQVAYLFLIWIFWARWCILLLWVSKDHVVFGGL